MQVSYQYLYKLIEESKLYSNVSFCLIFKAFHTFFSDKADLSWDQY